MKRKTFKFNRALAIQRVKEKLIHGTFPRMQMAFLVALTGACGLLASYTLLQFGLDSMMLRYPLALLFAYVFFMFLLWLWLRTNAEDYVDLPDMTGLIPDVGSACGQPEMLYGQGGAFDGGGASGDYISEPFNSIGDSVGSIADADELAIPLIAIVFALGIALASLYVIYIAPILFAELVVDGALSYALFRHLRGQSPQHWLVSTFRRTVMPFLMTAIFLSIAGAAMSVYAPGATSVGDVMRHAHALKIEN